MKLSKKILSLVLAVALVLGTVAVAANAETALTQFEGSVQTYTFEVDGAENGVLTVKPGDTFNLKVYMQTNYYVGSAGCELIIWNNNFFNAVATTDVTSSSFVTGWYSPTPTSPAASGMIPTAYKTTHTGVYINRVMNGAQTQAKALTTPELIYTIKFTVPETATEGTSATIFMPTESIYTSSNTRLGKIRQNIAESSTVYNQNFVSAYAQTVNVPTLTVKVASAAVLGEITDVQGSETYVNDTAVVTVNVTGAPEKLTVATPDGTYDYTRNNAYITTTATGEEWLIEVPVNVEGENVCTVTADYGEAGVTPATAFTVTGIGYCDYDALEAAVAKTPEKTEEYYDAEAYKAWADAKAAGQALLDAEKLYNKDGNQDKIDAAAQLIETTFAALEAKEVDLTKLNNAVDAYDELAYGKDYYDADLYAAWEAALADATAAQKTYDGAPATKQAEADKFADDLQAAFTALNPSILDLTALNNAIEASDETEYAAEYYDAAEYAAWEQALADAQAGVAQYTGAANTAANQQAVAALAQALTDAFAALDARFVDASAIANAITAYGTTEYTAEYYDVDEYAAYTAALAAANDADFAGKADTEANRAAVAKIADDLKVAYEALDARFVSLDELNNAIRVCRPMHEPEWFDAKEYAAWEAAHDAANEGLTTYEGKADTEENRAAVAKLAEDLRAAYNELDPRSVDVSDLEAALAESVPAYGEEYYDAAAYADFTAAVEAGAAIVDEMGGDAAPDTEENRATVADAAQAIRNTFAKLVPAFVSYEKLEKAVADYAQPEHPEFYYTPDSWAAYQDALAAANDANNNRPQPLPAANDNNQAAVDAYADALEKAYNELTAAVCHIISVTPLQEIYDLNDVINLSVLVEGKATKVQLIRGTNATSTYTRTHTSVKSITDNGDGTETWVIARRVYEKDYTEYAKAKFGKVWDTGVYAYDLVCKGDDISVKSIEVTLDGEVVDTVTRADLPTLTIVTGPAVKKLRLVDPVTGAAISFSAPVSVNEDGTKVWVIVKQYNQVKMYDLDVSVKGSAGWVDSGVDFELNVVKKVESQLPSTDNVEDAILSASVAKTRILRGATQTFTITTDKAAKSVRILKADGSVFTTISAPVSVEGDVATWTYECSYSSIGERSYTAEALYGNTWIADADSAVNFTVIY